MLFAVLLSSSSSNASIYEMDVPVSMTEKTKESGKEEVRFDLKVDEKTTAKKGQSTTLKVKLAAKDPWHVNMAFPTALQLDSTSTIQFAKQKLKKTDAVRLDEQGLEFAVQFTPTSAGKQKFSGKLKFAICKAESCSPVTKKLSFEVDVK